MPLTPHAPEVFHIYDTTLRDGAQQEGLRLSVADKLRIASLLDDLGVTHIEGGWPGANPNDTAFFAAAKSDLELRTARLVAFGATRKAGGTADTDPLIQALLDADTRTVCIVAKSHVGHVERALRTSLQENLEMVRETVSYLVGAGREVFLDCEHFFDGYLLDRGYALDVVRVAAEAGARVAVLCDTNGGMLPWQLADIVGATHEMGADLGIHCHNDTGCAVANSLSAVDAGVMHVQGTINGYGERTGNADLVSIIGDLQLKYGWEVIPPSALSDLTRISHAIAEVTNQGPQPRQPYVGASSFAHKAGLHASAIKIDPDLYQHVDPLLVGNDMRMLISDMAGRANIQIKGEALGFDLADRDVAAAITDFIKEREAEGYSYEAADASFELLLRRQLGRIDEPFTVLKWRVFTESVPGDISETDSQATLKLVANDEERNAVGEGNGPVNALDDALRAALLPVYPDVAKIGLIDYRVRIIPQEHGTDAIVRTLIDSSDGERVWTTVGVGTNVIEASWEALLDSYAYALTN